MNFDSYGSWGRYPALKPKEVVKLFWRNEIPDFNKFSSNILPFGYGKSYGDSCLNENGILIDTKGLNKFIAFDRKNGILRCESGVSLAAILDFIVPLGWFPATTPGTKFITIGGAVANDVHGKNHHKNGTFGCHVTQFELLRSSGERLICSPLQNSDLFNATIGGMGLTGLIAWVETKVQPCPSPFFVMETVKYNCLEEFYDLNDESDKSFDYTVAWVDTTATGANLGRGIYMRGNHADPKHYELPKLPKTKSISFPFNAPFINSLSVQAFNLLYYNKQLNNIEKKIVHYDPFFYPLDSVLSWNKAYGKNGFLQYQFVLPFENHRKYLKEMMQKISTSSMSSFLTVLKTFGEKKSPGMLSFPRPGVVMAVDFRMEGKKTLDKLDELDKIVRENGGAIYPAKDARMTGADFKEFYPNWEKFSEFIDPKFSSSFWRRVMS